MLEAFLCLLSFFKITNSILLLLVELQVLVDDRVHSFELLELPRRQIFHFLLEQLLDLSDQQTVSHEISCSLRWRLVPLLLELLLFDLQGKVIDKEEIRRTKFLIESNGTSRNLSTFLP